MRHTRALPEHCRFVALAGGFRLFAILKSSEINFAGEIVDFDTFGDQQAALSIEVARLHVECNFALRADHALPWQAIFFRARTQHPNYGAAGIGTVGESRDLFVGGNTPPRDLSNNRHNF